jgi:hypothetical protein
MVVMGVIRCNYDLNLRKWYYDWLWYDAKKKEENIFVNSSTQTSDGSSILLSSPVFTFSAFLPSLSSHYSPFLPFIITSVSFFLYFFFF